VVGRGGDQEDAERRPVAVEGERGHGDEEGEVGLRPAVRQPHESGAGQGEAERDEDRRQAVPAHRGRGHDTGQDQEDEPGAHGRAELLAHRAEAEQRDHAGGEQTGHQAMTPGPVLVAQPAAGRQPAGQRVGLSHHVLNVGRPGGHLRHGPVAIRLPAHGL